MNLWSLTFKVSDTGTVELTSMSEAIPPGEFELRGADDGNRVTLEARQRDEHGRFVIAALHRRDRAEEALHEAEDLAEAVEQAGGTAVIGVEAVGEMPA